MPLSNLAKVAHCASSASPSVVQAALGAHGVSLDLVQDYPEGHPEAEMGTSLASLRPGQKIEVKGPFGPFKYQPGKYKAIGGSPSWYSCIFPCFCMRSLADGGMDAEGFEPAEMLS